MDFRIADAIGILTPFIISTASISNTYCSVWVSTVPSRFYTFIAQHGATLNITIDAVDTGFAVSIST